MSQYGSVPHVVRMVIGWVKSALTEPISSEIPATRPSAHIIVTRTGGTPNLIFDHASLLVECFAQSHTASFDLANKVRDRLALMVGETIEGSVIYSVNSQAPIWQRDPDEPWHKSQFTVIMSCRTK